MFSDDAQAALRGHLEGWGETVVYRPRGGVPRPVRALVDRSPPAIPVGGMEHVTPQLVVTLEADAVRGVLPAELDTGGDLVEVALRKGGAPEARPITKLLHGEDGATCVAVD